MSVEAISAVLQHSRSTQGARCVLIGLANRADEHGIAWPGIEELRRAAGGMSRRGVQYALRRLERDGELEIVSDGEGGRNTTPLYAIRLTGLDGVVTERVQKLRPSRGATSDAKGRNPRQERAQPSSPEPLGNVKNHQTSKVPVEFAPLVSSLTAVVKAKGAKPLNVDVVVRACAIFADRDLGAEEGGFVHYWTDGMGENRQLRDVAGAWRNWLKRAPTASARKRRPTPRRERVTGRDTDAFYAEWERSHGRRHQLDRRPA